jgi:hypothetical protein
MGMRNALFHSFLCVATPMAPQSTLDRRSTSLRRFAEVTIGSYSPAAAPHPARRRSIGLDDPESTAWMTMVDIIRFAESFWWIS